MSSSFDLFREERISLPRTPFAALRALELGLAPPEAFVYLSTSVKPIEEEPIDQNEVSRILARKELDFEHTEVIMRALKKLSRSLDAETALFGSEGITTIETRYSRKIEACKAALAKKRSFRGYQVLASLHHELAQLHLDNEVLRRFHLRESFFASRALLEGRKLKVRYEELALVSDTLCDLGIPAQALILVKRFGASLGDRALFLEAAVRYALRDFPAVHECLRRYAAQRHSFRSGERGSICYWTGSCPE